MSSEGGLCHVGEEMRRVTYGEEGWPWEGSRVGRSWFANSELRTVDRPVEGLPSGRCPDISGSGEPGGIVGVKVARHHLVSTVLQKSVKIRGVVPRTGRRRRDVCIFEGQCGSPEVSLDCQNFRPVIIGEDATVRYPIRDGVVDEGDKSPTATPGRAIAGQLLAECQLLADQVNYWRLGQILAELKFDPNFSSASDSIFLGQNDSFFFSWFTKQKKLTHFGPKIWVKF